MGIEALTRTADGRAITPSTSADWLDWVSATATRSYILNDPLLDWLHLYGSEHGFTRDEELPGYDERTDMRLFLFEKGSAFEAAVVAHLRTLVDVATICGPGDSVRDLEKAEETWEAMRSGAPIIHQGALRDAGAMTYGAPDLLVRSDVLAELFPPCSCRRACTPRKMSGGSRAASSSTSTSRRSPT